MIVYEVDGIAAEELTERGYAGGKKYPDGFEWIVVVLVLMELLLD